MNPLLKELLPDLAILGGLSEAELEKVSALLTWHCFEAGELIARQGDIGSEMYIVGEGSCEECHVFDTPDESFTLARIGPGQCVGEMALIEIQPRSATLRAVTDVGLFVLSNENFMKLHAWSVDAYAMVVLNLARELSRRLRAANRVITGCVEVVGHVGK